MRLERHGIVALLTLILCAARSGAAAEKAVGRATMSPKLEPLDPAVTDEERAKWDVPSLDESRKRAEAMNAGPLPH